MSEQTNGKIFDVFITNHNADLGWVKLALLPKLEEAGMTVAVADERLVENGTGYKDFDEGVQDAQSVLAVITPSYCEDMKNQILLGLNGDEAVAYAAKQVNPDVVAAYPITPQTIMVERFSEYVADGEVETEFVAVES